MKKLSQTLLPILIGNCLVATVAFAQSNNLTFNGTEARPDTYVVKDGDTLYDLSGQYLGDSLLWPKLWSFNPQVTNPHWIYPGDILYLRGGIPRNAEVPVATESTPKKLTTWVLKREFVPMVAVLAEEDLKDSGEIVASNRDADLLRKYDPLWIKWQKDTPLPKKGDFYIAYHETDDDIPSDAYGDRKPYTVAGVLQITELPTDSQPYTGAKIVYSAREIERGDLLLPYQRQKLDVKMRPATTNLVGKIIYSVTPRTQLSEHNYIFIDQGSDNGVQPGNRFFVYQQGDQYLVDRRKEIEDIPMMRIGQLLVLSVDKQTSLAIVIDGQKEFSVGDRIEMYTGY